MADSVSLWSRITWRINHTIQKLKPFSDRLFRGIRRYKPITTEVPARMIEVPTSAWHGLELIIADIIKQSGAGNQKCLEFGVEFGYSAAVFSNYFKKVIGVDIFTGDPHAGFFGDIYEKTKSNLKEFDNITLIKSDYKDFIANNNDTYDFIHVDIIHTYEATYECGLWAANHSTCTIFHDTESFPDVKKAVLDIAKKTGKTFYNYVPYNGLGIIY